VTELLRITKEDGLDEARLERFRDYYRRVQASPMERRRELWWQQLTVADGLYEALVSDGLWERYAPGASKFWGKPQEWEVDAVERAVRATLELFGNLDAVSDTDLRVVSELAVKSLDDARFKDECSRRSVGVSQEPEPRPTLFVVPNPDEEEAA
jgi:hypothetical protein